MKTWKKYRETSKKYCKKTGGFWNNFPNILKDIGKNQKNLLAIFRRILEFFQKTSQKSLRKFLKFLSDFLEVFKILMLGNNVLWKLQGNFILILGKLWINIGVILNIIHFADDMKKFWKGILMKFVGGEPLNKFLSILMEIMYYFYFSFWKKLVRNCRKSIQLLVSI